MRRRLRGGRRKEAEKEFCRPADARSMVDTRVWAIGDLEAPGALERMLQRVSRPPDVGCTPSASCSAQRELILLHANHRRLRLLVNLAAQLRALRLDHTLALGFGASLCDALRRAAQPLACAHSSYMQRGALAEAAAQLPSKHIAWLQRWYYLRRLLEANVRVVALDTDMAITADPFPLLRDPAWLGARRLVTAHDFSRTRPGQVVDMPHRRVPARHDVRLQGRLRKHKHRLRLPAECDARRPGARALRRVRGAGRSLAPTN